jgi:hypothetical protein
MSLSLPGGGEVGTNSGGHEPRLLSEIFLRDTYTNLGFLGQHVLNGSQSRTMPELIIPLSDPILKHPW